MKGEYPLQNPRSHPTLFYGYWMSVSGSILYRMALAIMAERVGFEPTDRCRSTVFETARFGHSRTSPHTRTLAPSRVINQAQHVIKNLAVPLRRKLRWRTYRKNAACLNMVKSL